VRRGFPTGAAPVQTATAVHAQLALPIRSSAGDPGKVPLSDMGAAMLPCVRTENSIVKVDEDDDTGLSS
jgi:hypothetical protein